MRFAVLVLLTAGCAAPTAGDLRWMTTAVETESAMGADDAARCITRAAAGMQGNFGSPQSAAMAETKGGWEITTRNAQGVTGYVLVDRAGAGSRIKTWEIGDRQLQRVADGCR